MLVLLSSAPAGAFKKGNVTINGDLRVIGGLSVNRIASSSLSVNGSITVSGALRTGFVKAQAAKFSVLETTSLSSPSGSLQVTGDLNMQTSGAASFLEVGSLHTERLIQHRRRSLPIARLRTRADDPRFLARELHMPCAAMIHSVGVLWPAAKRARCLFALAF